MGEHDNDSGPVEGSKTSVTTLPCGQCGAELEFKPGAPQLKCQYCGHTQAIEIKDGAAVIEYDLTDAIARYLGAAPQMATGTKRSVKCQDCGADIIVEAAAQTARCDYCGGKRIVEEELPPEVLRPEALLPFTFDSKTAEERFRKWLAGTGFWGRLFVRLFRPGALTSRSSVNELHGIYVPYWTYDSHSQSNWTAQAGYYYYVTETYRDSQGKSQTRQVRKIRWVWKSGMRRDFFDDWLVCASRQYYGTELQKLMKEIEPFPTKAMVPYDSKYLAGFRAERYSIDLKAGWDIALGGIRAELYTRCGRDVPGDTHRYLEVHSSFWGQSFKHVLLPVFVMSYRFQEKPFSVLVNGSTGEVRGRAPVSAIKIVIFCLVIAALIGGTVALFMIFGGKGSQPVNQQHSEQPGASTSPSTAVGTTEEMPDQYYFGVEAIRAGSVEGWQVALVFAGADKAEKTANWQEFHSQNLKPRVEAEISSLLTLRRTDDLRKLQIQCQDVLAQKFKRNGKPMIASVELLKK
ncbi:MAG: hypothetical protein IPP14_06610 [Planctomycetes bacterium]|nr:hypothetical protein [Planctomycetota bacterium]